MSNLQWWAYLHVDSKLIVKRYFDERDLQDAEESPFCVETYGPITADSREEAEEKLEREFNRRRLGM